MKMKKENDIEIYKSEDLSISLERYERGFKFVEDNAELVLTTSQKGLETIANTAVSLAGIYRDLKQMEYSFKIYMEEAKKSMAKIAFAQNVLEVTTKRMDKLTDEIMSYDINTMSSEQIKYRSELLNSLNKQNDVILSLTIGVFNC